MKKSSYLLLMALAASVTASAQEKLKDVQENSLWASTVKVDGKLTELSNSFQAYNKTLKLFYTISNDSKAVYLQLKSSDPTTTAKIQAGGISFALNTADKKKEDDAFIITYPVVARPVRGQRGAGGPGGFGGGGRGGAGGGFGAFAMGGDSAQVKEAQQRFISASKEIKVAGFKDISDSLVSVYNEYGIKGAMNFEADGSLTYEVAVPLKQLGLTAGDGKEIAYNLKLNGLQIGGGRAGGPGGFGGGPGGGGDVVVGGGPGGGGAGGGFGGPGGGGGRGGFGGGGGGRGGFGGGGRPGGNTRPGANINFAELASSTDFWGKYKLAKQQ